MSLKGAFGGFMHLNFSQSETLIQLALSSPTWENFQALAFQQLKIPKQELVGSYINSLQKYPQLLANLTAENFLHLAKFMSFRALKESPLYKKLTPNQLENLKVTSNYSTLKKILNKTL